MDTVETPRNKENIFGEKAAFLFVVSLLTLILNYNSTTGKVVEFTLKALQRGTQRFLQYQKCP